MPDDAERPAQRSNPLSETERRFYAHLIEELKRRRQELGLSQAAMDDRLGVSEGCVAKWESYARLPGAFFLMCWVEALDGKLTIAKKEIA